MQGGRAGYQYLSQVIKVAGAVVDAIVEQMVSAIVSEHTSLAFVEQSLHEEPAVWHQSQIHVGNTQVPKEVFNLVFEQIISSRKKLACSCLRNAG